MTELNNERKRWRLAKLIRDNMGDEKPRALAANAARLGHKLSYAQIYEYLNDTASKAPSRAQCEALGAVLDVPAFEVYTAMCLDWYEWLPPMGGLPMGESLMDALPLEIKSFLRMAGLTLKNVDPEDRRTALIDDLTKRILAAAN